MTTTDHATTSPVIDVHCHFSLTRRRWERPSPFGFERAEYAPLAAYISPRHLRRIGIRLTRLFVSRGRSLPLESLDARFEALQLEHLLTFRHVDQIVLLAFDEVHDDDGHRCGPRKRAREIGTDMYVSNGLVRAFCETHPHRFLFGASIHPYRRHRGQDAIALLDEVLDAGAVLIKWLPPVHNIDPTDPRTVTFLRHCAQRGVPLLVHYGPEFTLGTNRRQCEDPRPMLATLRQLRSDGCMPTVIMAHVATPILWPLQRGVEFHQVVDALTNEFADAPLYADIAALGAPSKVHWLRKILSMPALWPKLVHGSDFPIPTFPLFFRDRLGYAYHEVVATSNWIDRDYLLKRKSGLPSAVFTRASELLRM